LESRNSGKVLEHVVENYLDSNGLRSPGAIKTRQWFEEASIVLLLALAELFLGKIQGKQRQFGDSLVIRTNQRTGQHTFLQNLCCFTKKNLPGDLARGCKCHHGERKWKREFINLLDQAMTAPSN